MAPRRVHDLHDVVADRGRDVDPSCLLDHLRDALRIRHRTDHTEGLACAVRLEDLRFDLHARIADRQSHHEAVELGLGERIRSLVFDRVLRRDHHERCPQGVRLGVDRDLSLFHAFQQCGLGLRGSTVDLVAQHDVREHGSRAELEVPTLLVEHVHAGDVCREHVRRELDAAERTVDRACDRFREHRLPDAGNVLDQQVSLGDQRYQRQADLCVLAAEDTLHVLFDLSEAGTEALPFARLLTKLQPTPPLGRTLIVRPPTGSVP